MDDSHIMQGFPPPPEAQATLANWREPPFNRWAFQHLREIVPTAPVARGDGPSAALAEAPRDLDGIAFDDVRGGETTVGAWLDESFTDGFMVLHGGRVAAERYANGMTPASLHILMSVSKSVTGSLAGILADRGVLDPDAPVTRYVPECAGSAYGDATVRHVLDMTVGIRFVEDYEDETGDFARYRMATGWRPATDPEAPMGLRNFLPTLRQDGENGAAFHYVSPNSDLLGWILERASGTRFSDLLAGELWQPMDAERDACIGLDPLGAPRSAGGLCVSLRDLARFGQMHLDGGRANGRQVVPEWWVRDIRENGDRNAWAGGVQTDWLPDGRYRSKWYATGNPHGAYCGIGIHGQWLWIDPAANVVCAKLSSLPTALETANDGNTMRAFHAIGSALA